MPTLDFKGKQFVYSHHHTVPFRELKVDEGKSHPAADKKANLNDNLIIHGDNLHALKALMPRYAGKVKCIYIDPPYNTGNEGWVYNDNVNSPLMKHWLKDMKPVDREDMERHDKWLCMMYPRLKLLHELLADDGVIFVSIDDNEVHHLRMLMDEVFGEEKFVGIFSIKTPNQTESSVMLKNMDHLLCYAKKIDGKLFYLDSKPQTARCTTSNELQTQPEIEFPSGIEVRGVEDGIYNQPEQIGSNEDVSVVSGKIVVRNGNLAEPVVLKARWSNPNDIKAFCDKIRNNSDKKISNKFKKELVGLWFKGKRFQPQMDKIGFDLPESIWTQFSKKGGDILRQLVPDEKFDYPKHPDFIRNILKISTDQDSIILDSFAGSGTTAHAALDLNKEDGGNRKFILVECEGYADSITAERVRRVIKGVPTAKDEKLKNGLGGSFTFCELGQAMEIEKMLTGESLPNYENLASYVFYTSTGKSLEKPAKSQSDFFVGETDLYEVYLIYKPDLAFLRGNESALNFDKVEVIKSRSGSKKTKLVFATAKFMGQKEMAESGITFCQLPYAIHKIAGK